MSKYIYNIWIIIYVYSSCVVAYLIVKPWTHGFNLEPGYESRSIWCTLRYSICTWCFKHNLFFQFCFCKGLLKISLREGLFPFPQPFTSTLLSHHIVVFLVYTHRQTGRFCKDIYLSCYIFHKIKLKIWLENLEYPIIKQMFLFHSRKKNNRFSVQRLVAR